MSDGPVMGRPADPPPGGEGQPSPEDPSTFLAPGAGDGSPEEASRLVRAAMRRSPLPSVAGLCFEIMGLAWVFGAFVGFWVLAYLVRTLFPGGGGGIHGLLPGSDDLAGAGESGPVIDAISDALALVKLDGVVRITTATHLAELIACVALISWVCVRVGAGLARIASDGGGQGSGANALHAFRIGGRTQVSALGIWVQIAGMMASGTIVLFGPVALLSRATGGGLAGPLHVVLAGLAIAVSLAYGAALGAVHSLSMASLVRHERGVGSAILHAWRLVRNRRATAGRMAFVEGASRVAILGLAILAGHRFGPWAGLAVLVTFGALAGGMRCHAWSLAYPRVGGLS